MFHCGLTVDRLPILVLTMPTLKLDSRLPYPAARQQPPLSFHLPALPLLMEQVL